MMTWVLSILVIIGVTTAAIQGNMENISEAILLSGEKAVGLCLTLAGSLCLWSGIMKIAVKSGLTEKISNLMYPIINKIFRGLKRNSAECQAISMNLAANFMGLGNAATPAGIIAIQEMQKTSAKKDTATDNMILFVVLNTASIQIIPTTIAMLRLQAGSNNPMEVLPAIWISSLLSVTAGIIAAKVFGLKGNTKKSG